MAYAKRVSGKSAVKQACTFLQYLEPGCGDQPGNYAAALRAAHAEYMREYSRNRYHSDAAFRAAVIQKSIAHIQLRRQDPAYRAREAELQRLRRQRGREMKTILAVAITA